MFFFFYRGYSPGRVVTQNSKRMALPIDSILACSFGQVVSVARLWKVSSPNVQHARVPGHTNDLVGSFGYSHAVSVNEMNSKIDLQRKKKQSDI